VGLEHRKEGSGTSDAYETFALEPNNDLHTVIHGQSQSTDSLYTEVEIPLVTPKNALPWIHTLDLQFAGRYERYTASIGTPFTILAPIALAECCNPPQGVHSTVKYSSANPTVGFKYQPVGDLILRASYATAFLPPTPTQLLPQSMLDQPSPYAQIIDPRNNQTYLVNTLSGGNPSLRPQTSRDWDLGVVFEPQEERLKGLRIDLEHYRITQPNYITQPTPQEIVSDPTYAGRVTRDPGTGLITVVNISYVNATQFKTQGWDL
jgi:outer membrane receptor protein involved in Fe transport